jgi:hypothetical protein
LGRVCDVADRIAEFQHACNPLSSFTCENICGDRLLLGSGCPFGSIARPRQEHCGEPRGSRTHPFLRHATGCHHRPRELWMLPARPIRYAREVARVKHRAGEEVDGSEP